MNDYIKLFDFDSFLAKKILYNNDTGKIYKTNGYYFIALQHLIYLCALYVI